MQLLRIVSCVGMVFLAVMFIFSSEKNTDTVSTPAQIDKLNEDVENISTPLEGANTVEVLPEESIESHTERLDDVSSNRVKPNCESFFIRGGKKTCIAQYSEAVDGIDPLIGKSKKESRIEMTPLPPSPDNLLSPAIIEDGIFENIITGEAD